MNRRPSVLALFVILALVLAACEAEPGTTSPSAATSTRASTTNAAAATPTARPLGLVPASAATATETAEPAATATPELPEATPTNEPTGSDVPAHIAEATANYGDAVQVDRVVDGDTIDVVLAGAVVRVRIIGVDTPEVHGGVDCYGPEASARTTELIEQAGWLVFLEKDVSETDRYDRLLRYVWLPHPDGLRMLNYELVASGHAQVSTYPPDVKYQEMFLEAQRTAGGEGRGLWGGCVDPTATPAPQPTNTPVPPPVAEPTPTSVPPPPPPAANCDPSYPTVCIPPYPPDLNCGDIPHKRFKVLPPDPHGFDRDKDGIGCES